MVAPSTAQTSAPAGLPGQAHGGAEPTLALHPTAARAVATEKAISTATVSRNIPAKEQHGERARAQDQRRANEKDGHHGHDHHRALVGAASASAAPPAMSPSTLESLLEPRWTGPASTRRQSPRCATAAKVAPTVRGMWAPGRPRRAVAAGPEMSGTSRLPSPMARPPHQPRRPRAQHQQIADAAHRQRDQVPQCQRIHAQHHLQVRGGPSAAA